MVHDASTLHHSLTAAAEVSPDHPAVITKFIEGAQEIDIDAAAYQGNLLVHAVSEHVEQAGKLQSLFDVAICNAVPVQVSIPAMQP